MTLLLRNRSAALRELMDDPDCDPELLHNTYAQFALVNRAISGWRRIFLRQLLPLAGTTATLLDVGCGGGDLLRSFARWAGQAGVTLELTGVDPDPRALEFARSQVADWNITWRQATAGELAAEGRQFDFVISNHVLHHLPEEELPEFLAVSARLARRRAVHNDLRRSDVAFAAFALTWPFFRNSYITGDGLRSIRRSFTVSELRGLLPAGWRIEPAEPFRSVLIHDVS